jgi:hypothetical protein
MQRKVELMDSIIFSKIKYAVAPAWLSKKDLRRLDGFQARCLRQAFGIAHSFRSRVSNQRVREIAGRQPLSQQIKDVQLKLLEKVLTVPSKKELRDATFLPQTDIPLTSAYVRKVGKPRHNWAEQLLKMRSTL